MTPQEFAQEMRKIKDKCDQHYQLRDTDKCPEEALYYDNEAAHGDMDDLMAKALRESGYAEGVDIYDQQEKWYA